MTNIIADIHCHPSMKPYGLSFPGRTQSAATGDTNNLYFYNPVTERDKILNALLGLTRYSQANFTALKKGAMNIVFCSLYPIEKGFCRTNYGTGDLITNGINLAMGTGTDRINFIQDVNNGYFEDLQKEYQFLQQLDGTVVNIEGNDVVYKIVSRFSDIQNAGAPAAGSPYVLYVFVSIEGAHVFYSNFADIPDSGTDALPAQSVQDDVYANIDTVKNWPNRPYFMTIGHHFWNGFLGHAPSLTDGPIAIVTNQQNGINLPIQQFGFEVLKRLLDNTNNNRILVDIKHMSVTARQQYFQFLADNYAGDNIPIIVSHGAVRGNENDRKVFYDEPINFTDDEIRMVGESKGLFGVQFDKRRIAAADQLLDLEDNTARGKVLGDAAELIWAQIEHIALVLDYYGLDAWGVQCIGSDNDGIVNPINALWSAEDFPDVRPYLVSQAQQFLTSATFRNLKNDFNKQVPAAEIVDRFMGGNVYNFLGRNG